MLLDILQFENTILRQNAKELDINEIKSKKTREIIESMKETMRSAPGVGLAAPQVGISLQIAVIEDREEYMLEMKPDIRKERGRKPILFHVLINPKLTFISEEKVSFFEACLSVKGCARITQRAQKVKVEYYDEHANKKSIHADGWYARILQHEIDHLHGKLYTDISDKRTEITNTDINKKKWLNGTSKEVEEYFANFCVS